MSAVHALVAIDYDSTLQTITNELRSTDPHKRAKAACILGWFEDQGGPAIPPLLECLRDEDQQVRAEAVLSLGRIRMEPDLVVPALLEKLNEEDSMLRTWTVLALAHFGQRAKPAVPAIQDLLAHHKINETYRAQVLQALGAIASEVTNSVAN